MPYCTKDKYVSQQNRIESQTQKDKWCMIPFT